MIDYQTKCDCKVLSKCIVNVSDKATFDKLDITLTGKSNKQQVSRKGSSVIFFFSSEADILY